MILSIFDEIDEIKSPVENNTVFHLSDEFIIGNGIIHFAVFGDINCSTFAFCHLNCNSLLLLKIYK